MRSSPGEKTALWSFNHDTGRFGVVGPMTANADASLVCTDPGVGVPAPGWHGWNPGVPTRRGPVTPNRPPPPPPPPLEEEEECEPGKVECEQKENYQPQPNGCGPQALIDKTGDLAIYNNPVLVYLPVNALVGTGCDFRPSCNTHDVGYGQCESSPSQKDDVDTTFLNDMQSACDACYSDFNKPGKTVVLCRGRGSLSGGEQWGQALLRRRPAEVLRVRGVPRRGRAHRASLLAALCRAGGERIHRQRHTADRTDLLSGGQSGHGAGAAGRSWQQWHRLRAGYYSCNPRAATGFSCSTRRRSTKIIWMW